MASVYPAGMCARYDYALDPHEHNLRDFFFRNGWSLTSGMWGARGDPPVVRHIGEVSRGVKVSPGDPDHTRFARLPTDADYHFETGERVDERERVDTALTRDLPRPDRWVAEGEPVVARGAGDLGDRPDALRV